MVNINSRFPQQIYEQTSWMLEISPRVSSFNIMNFFIKTTLYLRLRDQTQSIIRIQISAWLSHST